MAFSKTKKAVALLMDAPPLEKIVARLKRLDDVELKAIVTVEAADYRDDVVQAARTELTRRGIELPENLEAFVDGLSESDLEESRFFCAACMRATVDERAPGPGQGFGHLQIGHSRCSDCDSVRCNYVFAIKGIPIYTIDRYLVKVTRPKWPGHANGNGVSTTQTGRWWPQRVDAC